MKSQTRQECEDAVVEFSKIINANVPPVNKLLYVGTAGDPIGGEYSPLFRHKFDVKTFDCDPHWRPDIVGDITKTDFQDESWGAIVCVQVLEHIKNVWDVPKEMNRILCKGGYAIVDTPWLYPYHAEPPSFGDYWRISKDGMEALFGSHFKIEHIISTNNLTSCLIKKL